MSTEDDKDLEEVPEGMVRRTRKVRKKRKGKKTAEEGKAHADTLFAKAKDLLVGMEEENDDHGHVDLAEQIRRLKKKKEDDRPLDEIWGSKRRSSSWLWIVLVGLIVSVVLIIIGGTMWMSDESGAKGGPTEITSPVGTLDEMDLSAGPLGWFDENSVEVLDEAKKILELVNRAESSGDFVKFVRDSPNRREDELDPTVWGADCLTNATSNFSWTPSVVNSSEGSGANERGYLKISGQRVDRTPFEAYFVESDSRLLLDWDASLGWSEMSVAEIAQTKPRKDIFLRCRVTRKTSFDQEFGKIQHAGCVISGENEDEYFFAYVPLNTERGKVIDRDLRLLLNYRSFVSLKPPLENQKATLRVRYDSDKGIFEIVEFLHDGWVSP